MLLGVYSVGRLSLEAKHFFPREEMNVDGANLRLLVEAHGETVDSDRPPGRPVEPRMP